MLCGMPLIYVTGISGAGKSAVCDELQRRGYEAHDTDREENAVWVNRKTGAVTARPAAPDLGPPDWLEEHEWRVVASKVEALAQRADGRIVFLCGSTANEHEVWHLFSRVICLAIDRQTLRRRLASRTTNDFGKSPNELRAILAWQEVGDDEYRRLGAAVVDATCPLDEVVDHVLSIGVPSIGEP
jgi:AAA domain